MSDSWMSGSTTADVESILRKALGFAARFLPTVSCETTIKLPLSRSNSSTLLREAFYSWGRVALGNLDTSKPVIITVVGSGVLNLNPTVLVASLGPSEGTQTEIHLASNAKEGLIKQRSAEKALAVYKPILETAKKIKPATDANASQSSRCSPPSL